MSNKDHNIIFLSANSLSLFINKKVGSLKIPESIDNQKYKKILESFFENQPVKQEAFSIILADELVFKKTIPLSKPEEVQGLYDKFLIQIPIMPEQAVVLRSYQEKNLIVLATNRDFFVTVKKVLEQLGGRVKGVAPFSAKNVNFLSEETKVSPQIPIIRKSKKSNRQNKLFISIFLIIALGLIGIFSRFMVTDLSKKTIEENVAKNTNPIVINQASSSAQPNTLIRNEISINILNSSGVERQALKIKSELEKANFVNINLYTLPTQKGISVIQFGPKMTANMAKDVLTVAKKVVNLSEEASPSAKADVIIIIKK